jgi:hypothetical protein
MSSLLFFNGNLSPRAENTLIAAGLLILNTFERLDGWWLSLVSPPLKTLHIVKTRLEVSYRGIGRIAQSALARRKPWIAMVDHPLISIGKVVFPFSLGQIPFQHSKPDTVGRLNEF